MKRLEFLRNMSLIGAGLALAPIRLFSKNSNVRSYRLPKATVHIPHGNFAASENELLTISELEIQLSVERFMRNGIEECGDDLLVVSISRANESIMVCFSANQSEVSGTIRGLDLNNTSEVIKIESTSSILKLRKGSDFFQISKKA